MRARLANIKALTDAFRSLRNRNYRLFWSGQLVSLAGTWMQDVALSWLVLEISQSPEALGLTMTIRFLPALLFSLYGGVLADRLRKRPTIMVCEGTQGVVALALAVLNHTGLITVGIIYILAAVRGFIDAIEGPTRQAFVSEMVKPKDLPNAVALNSTLFNGARVIGPAIGAAIIASPVGVTGCFYLNAVSYLAVVGAMWAMRPRDLYVVPRISREGSLRQMWEGLRFIRSSPELLVIFIVMTALGAFGLNLQTLLPLITKFTLSSDASTFALLTTTMGIGSVVAGLFVAYRSRPSLRLFLSGSAVFTILLLAIGLSRWTALTAVLLFLIGVSAVLTMTTANTRLQLGSPGDLRGRVMGMYIVVFIGTTPIGSYLIGFLAEHASTDQKRAVFITVVTIFALCAVGIIAGVVYAFHARRRVGIARPEDPLEEGGGRA
jgi:MFS family permease